MSVYTFCPMYRLLLATALLLAPIALCAQGKNVSIAPAPDWLAPYGPDLSRKVNAKDFSDGYYQLLLEEQHHLEKKTIYRHIIRQIETEAGIQNGSEINVDYSPEYEKLQFHQILIRRNGKVINQLNLRGIKVLQQEQDLSMFIYSGRYNAYYILEDVRKGDQIEYSYSVVGENPVFAGKYSHTFYLASYEPVANYYKALIAAPARQLNFRYYDNAPRPAEKKLNGLRLYEWDLGNKVTILKPETSQPGWYMGFPYVDVSEFADWAEVAQWGAAVNNMPLNGKEVMERAARLKNEAQGDTAKYMEAAIRFVQDNIRYMGIEMGEYSHRPNTPEKVCKQRFGDCKDKALLLTALLRAQGIEADMAYVHTDFRGHIAERLPSPDRFNHAIVKARFRSQDYWIDATVAYQRGRLALRYNPSFKKGLVVKAGTTGLTDIPVGNPGSIAVTETFDIPHLDNDSALLTVNTVYKGRNADGMRAELANSALADMETSYTEFYGKKYGKVEMRDSMRINDNDSLNEIRVEEFYTIREPWTIDSAKKLSQSFTTPAHMLISKVTFIDKNRKTPVALEYPLNVQHYITIKFPENWQVEAETIDLDRADYRFTAKSSVFLKTVQLRYSFESKNDHIPANSLQQYRLDMDELSKFTSYNFTWTPGASELGAKKTGSSSPHWPTLLTALVAGAVFCWLCLQFNKRSLPSSYPVQTPWDIGSWLIFVAIGVLVSPLRVLSTLFQLESFRSSTWAGLSAAYPGKNILVFQAFLILEVLGIVFILALTVFSALLFYRKRDIFPRVYSFMLAFNLIWTIADFSLADALMNTNSFADGYSTLLSSGVTAALWIPVMLLSKRVKHTFVLPYEAA